MVKNPVSEIKQPQVRKSKVILMFTSISSMLSLNTGKIILMFKAENFNVHTRKHLNLISEGFSKVPMFYKAE